MRCCSTLLMSLVIAAAAVTRLSRGSTTTCSDYRDLSNNIGDVMAMVGSGTWCDADSAILHYSWQVQHSTDLYQQIEVYCRHANNSGSWIIVQERSFDRSADSEPESAVYSLPPHLLSEGSQATCAVRGCYLVAGQLTEYLTNTVTVNCSLEEAVTDTPVMSQSLTAELVTVTSSSMPQSLPRVTQDRDSLSPSHTQTHSRVVTSKIMPVPTKGLPVGQTEISSPLVTVLIIVAPVTVVLVVPVTAISLFITCFIRHRNKRRILSPYNFKDTEFDSSLRPPLGSFAPEVKTPYHSQYMLFSEDDSSKEKKPREDDKAPLNVAGSLTDSPSASCEWCSSEHELELHVNCKTSCSNVDDLTRDSMLQKSVFTLSSGLYSAQCPLKGSFFTRDNSDGTTGGGGVVYEVGGGGGGGGGGDGDSQVYYDGRESKTDDITDHFQFYELPALSGDTQTCQYQTSSSGYVTDTSSTVISPFGPGIAFEYLQTDNSLPQQPPQHPAHTNTQQELQILQHREGEGCYFDEDMLALYPDQCPDSVELVLSDSRDASPVMSSVDDASSKERCVHNSQCDAEYDTLTSELATTEECVSVINVPDDVRLPQATNSATINSKKDGTISEKGNMNMTRCKIDVHKRQCT